MKNRRKICDYKYYVIRAQMRRAEKRISTKENDKYKVLIRFDNIANSVNAWIRLKELLKDKIDYDTNDFNLVSITENDLIAAANQMYEERKLITVDESETED